MVLFNRQRYALRGPSITVVAYSDGRIKLLPYKVFNQPQPGSSPVDNKTLNARMDGIVKGQNKANKPAANHPWRNYPEPIPPPATG